MNLSQAGIQDQWGRLLLQQQMPRRKPQLSYFVKIYCMAVFF